MPYLYHEPRLGAGQSLGKLQHFDMKLKAKNRYIVHINLRRREIRKLAGTSLRYTRTEQTILANCNTRNGLMYTHSMDEPTIRVAAPSEQQELEQLQTRASLANEGDRDALLAHPDAIELPTEQIAGGGVFVSEWMGVIVGFAAVEPRADGETELDALFVDPCMQRRGIGRLLIKHCAKIARQRGCTALHVVANPHANSFYVACGFEAIGTTETRFGPGLLMRKMVWRQITPKSDLSPTV